jgi:two-component system sensor histidine kinase YesM
VHGLRKWSFSFKTVRSKLILYALSMLIPVAVFSTIYLVQSQKLLQTKAGQLVNESLTLSTNWMDEVLNGAVRLSAMAESDTMLRNFVSMHQDTNLSGEEALTIWQIEHRMSDILSTENRATSVWIYFSATGEVLSTQFGSYQVDDMKGLQYLKLHMTNDRLSTWIYPENKIKRNGGSLLDLTGASGNAHVTFARAIPGMGTQENPVIVGVGYLEFTLQDLFNEVSHLTKTSLLLLNGTGQLVDSESPTPEQPVSISAVMEQLKRNHDPNTPSFIFDKKLVASSTSKLTGWQIIAVAPLKNYMGGIQRLNGLTICFTLSALLFALITARSLTTGFHLPLKQLLMGMKRVETGDLNVRIPDNRSDEFSRLAKGFNRMVETQNHLIRTVYQERIAKQQAEMNYLTSQINPHFLYNTLGALYAMAKKVDATLGESLLAMSRLFRLSLNKGRDLTTVEESIELIGHYIHLLNIRNPGKYKLETYVEPGAENRWIPRLVIQPIVENAVKHGLELLPSQGVIRIQVTLLQGHVLLMISDNGTGMSEETLNELRDTLDSDEIPIHQPEGPNEINGSGYALCNIYRRLKLKYEERFTFRIESSPGKGTTVTLKIPQ